MSLSEYCHLMKSDVFPNHGVLLEQFTCKKVHQTGRKRNKKLNIGTPTIKPPVPLPWDSSQLSSRWLPKTHQKPSLEFGEMRRLQEPCRKVESDRTNQKHLDGWQLLSKPLIIAMLQKKKTAQYHSNLPLEIHQDRQFLHVPPVGVAGLHIVKTLHRICVPTWKNAAFSNFETPLKGCSAALVLNICSVRTEGKKLRICTFLQFWL